MKNVRKDRRLSWRDLIPDRKTLGKIVAYVALLYALQIFVFVPFMTYVVESDFFSAPGTFSPIEGDAGEAAQIQCRRFFRQEMNTERVEFPLRDTKVWAMESGRFLVKASAVVTDDLELAHRINYTCYVKYRGGNLLEAASWKLKGLDWLAAE